MISVRFIKGLGYYWHCSRLGRPGEQSDYFTSFDECIADARNSYPDIPISNIIID